MEAEGFFQFGTLLGRVREFIRIYLKFGVSRCNGCSNTFAFYSPMTDNSFFEEPTEQSQIKSRIVAKYFWAWANVMKSTAMRGARRIEYVDLFSGPGRYRDGTASTPLLVLQKALADAQMRELLASSFNDSNPENSRTLQAEINKLDGISKLKFKPRVSADVVNDSVVASLSNIRLVPTLFFIDPWGYKGLSLDLVRAALKNWGCDCIFFFNYNRINPALNNDSVRVHMDALFGESRAEALRTKLSAMNSSDRELTIIEELARALQEVGGKYVLPFTFQSASGERTSHHLFLVTKNFRGYEIMKTIMAGESSEKNQGVASFEYLPASSRQPLLFELQRPLDDLQQMLMSTYAGRTLTRKQIYEEHSVGRPYLESNYREVLIRLESEGRIRTDPPRERRRITKGGISLGENVKITFPS